MEKNLKVKIFEQYFLNDTTPTYAKIAERLKLDINAVSVQINELMSKQKEEIKRIKNVKQLYRNKKKEKSQDFEFNSFKEFYGWYEGTYREQKGKCYYCETSEEDVAKLVEDRSKRSPNRGRHLEVERKDSTLGKDKYNPNNCVLCCYICNNAKSDIFSPEEFKLIQEAIKETIMSIKPSS
ncbi:MAG: hypothetical protein PHE58_07950 [Candidatus Omnitrophica bacterium]|nr:hypothetical protein [Candidatus Omnitrophota bacterium]